MGSGPPEVQQSYWPACATHVRDHAFERPWSPRGSCQSMCRSTSKSPHGYCGSSETETGIQILPPGRLADFGPGHPRAQSQAECAPKP